VFPFIEKERIFLSNVSSKTHPKDGCDDQIGK